MAWNELENLFRQRQRQLFMLAVAVTGNRALAEDAVHDALLSVASTASRPRNLRAYLEQSVRHAAIRLIRRQRDHEPVEESTLFDGSPDPGDRAFGSQLTRQLATLGIDQRETVVLRMWAGMTFQEIATYRSRSLHTVTSWYRRGIEKLREELSNEEL